MVIAILATTTMGGAVVPIDKAAQAQPFGYSPFYSSEIAIAGTIWHGAGQVGIAAAMAGGGGHHN